MFQMDDKIFQHLIYYGDKSIEYVLSTVAFLMWFEHKLSLPPIV